MKAKQIDMKVNNTMMNAQNIDNLLRLFMEGQTTEQQEHDLKQYFLTHKDVPAEWEPYRVLFQSFETGIYDYAPPTHRRKWAWKRVAIWSTTIAAAIIAAFFLIDRPRPIAPTQPQLASTSNNNRAIQPNQTNQDTQPNQANQPNQPNQTNLTNLANRPNQTNQPNQAIRSNQPIQADPNPPIFPISPNNPDTPPQPIQPNPQPINPVTITAHQTQAVAVLQEDDLPITNPEALRLTHDDIAQMARHDAQRYIEMLRIDLENQKYEINHPSQIQQVVVI